jgi:hypothetical protein
VLFVLSEYECIYRPQIVTFYVVTLPLALRVKDRDKQKSDKKTTVYQYLHSVRPPDYTPGRAREGSARWRGGSAQWMHKPQTNTDRHRQTDTQAHRARALSDLEYCVESRGLCGGWPAAGRPRPRGSLPPKLLATPLVPGVLVVVVMITFGSGGEIPSASVAVARVGDGREAFVAGSRGAGSGGRGG